LAGVFAGGAVMMMDNGVELAERFYQLFTAVSSRFPLKLVDRQFVPPTFV
jgi:hypothetical protein